MIRGAFIRWLLLVIVLIFAQSCRKDQSDISSSITPETALKAYLSNDDATYKWELKSQLKAVGITYYQLLLNSQTWQTIPWTHDLMVIVPDNMQYSEALLIINGGSNNNGLPNTHPFTDSDIQYAGSVALTQKAVVILLWQIPNQPIYGLTEDALISKTLSNYLGDHDFSWPLLFPMTKSAVRAMDASQEFLKKQVGKQLNGFVVTGASKRGWTTWLSGAVDSRVIAIAPMVIDILNMPVNVDYQKKVWGDYSYEIQDYVKLGIAQQVSTPGGSELVSMIDPYSYLTSLTMPKMIFFGTNDPYWPVDAVKNYLDNIPGDNRLCYTPNAGHDLGNGSTALSTLNAFFSILLSKSALPKCDYLLTEAGGKINLTVNTTPELLLDATLWSANSTADQDFRNDAWTNKIITVTDKSVIKAQIDYPIIGYKAFYVDIKYKSPLGLAYTTSTRVFVSNTSKVL